MGVSGHAERAKDGLWRKRSRWERTAIVAGVLFWAFVGTGGLVDASAGAGMLASSANERSAVYTERSVVPPPAPQIVATRAGKRVRIAYSFPVWPNDSRRPVMLLTSVQSSGPRYAPFMKRHRFRSGPEWFGSLSGWARARSSSLLPRTRERAEAAGP